MTRLFKDAGRPQAVSPLPWILLGFGISYVCFFVYPIFLSQPGMQVPLPLPAITPIGTDLKQSLVAARDWMLFGGSAYAGNAWYSPVAYLLMWPLYSVPHDLRFAVVTGLTLLAFVGAALIFPLAVDDVEQPRPELLLVFASGLVSYGLLFEIERGQFDVIAAALVFASIWVHARYPHRRLWGYVLFTLAVQIKLWPAVFVVLLVQDLRDWKAAFRRVGLLALANAALLLFDPHGSVLDLVHALGREAARADTTWIGDHSIHSFSGLVAGRAALRGWAWLASSSAIVEAGLIFLVVALLGAVVLMARRRPAGVIDPDLLLACTLAALLLPPQSNDYVLAILVGPAAIFLLSLGRRFASARRPALVIVAIVLFSLAYSATLFPVSYKPQNLVIANSFPALLLMLLAVVAIRALPESTDATGAAAA